jgi:uncharacterized protein (DUF1919 family)
MRNQLTNKDFTLISSNCISGILSHDLGLEFRSPTVNLFFTADDFVKFCLHLDEYLKEELISDDEMSKEKGYPVSRLWDIHLYGVHYHSHHELMNAWNRRKERINHNNLFICMTDRNDCTNETVAQFAKVPYPKVLFSHKPYSEYPFVVYVPDFSKESEVGQLQFYADMQGHRYYEKYFDWTSWLNKYE